MADQGQGGARRPRGRAVGATAVGAVFLHTVAVLSIWASWGPGVRSGWLLWMDLPVSLLFAEARGGAVLAWSLALGGLWWGVLGALLSALVGVLAGRRWE